MHTVQPPDFRFKTACDYCAPQDLAAEARVSARM